MTDPVAPWKEEQPMARSGIVCLEFMSLAAIWTLAATAAADEPKVENAFRRLVTQVKPATVPADAKALTCTIYSLTGLGGDPSLGQWISETIPEVVAPTTWQHVGGEGRLSYHGPAKILVVYQSAAVHSQIDAFLNSIKKAVPQAKQPAVAKMGRMTTGDDSVVPTQFTITDLNKQTDTAAAKSSAYPVPAPLQQPKHLFHVVIRYEGDGIVDTNVVDLVKSFTGDDSAKEEKGDKSEQAKPSKLNQLFNFIIRYEGDGIIDANVVELFKAYMDSVGKEDKSSPAPILPQGIVPPNAPACPLSAPNVSPGTILPSVSGLPVNTSPATSSGYTAPMSGPSFGPQAAPTSPATRPLTMPPATTLVTPVPTVVPVRNAP
jgi:hypothetical protein